MNTNTRKIAKLNLEYTKNDKRIARLLGRQKEIERQRTELENLEIVGMVRELGMSFEDFSTLINGKKAVEETAAELSEEVASDYAAEMAVQAAAEGGVWHG